MFREKVFQQKTYRGHTFAFASRALLLLGLVAALNACGWRLRGTLVLPPGLDQVHITQGEDTRELADMMKQMLQANDVTLVDDASQANLTIDLESYREQRRVTSVGSNTLVSEFELVGQAQYRILDESGNELLPSSETAVTRSYQFDENDVVGKAEEERIIQREMRGDLARQIIYRLRFLTENTTP